MNSSQSITIDSIVEQLVEDRTTLGLGSLIENKINEIIFALNEKLYNVNMQLFLEDKKYRNDYMPMLKSHELYFSQDPVFTQLWNEYLLTRQILCN